MRLNLDVNVVLKFDAIHVHLHEAPGSNAEVLKAIDNLRKATTSMNAKLQAALTELVGITAANTSKIASLTDIVKSFPGLVAAAVTQALADADVEAETAAGIIHDAGHTASDNVQALLDAAETSTGTDIDGDGDVGNDTTSGGGEDTVSGGDTLEGGGGDTLEGGAGGDVVEGEAASGDETTSG